MNENKTKNLIEKFKKELTILSKSKNSNYSILNNILIYDNKIQYSNFENEFIIKEKVNEDKNFLLHRDAIEIFINNGDVLKDDNILDYPDLKINNLKTSKVINEFTIPFNELENLCKCISSDSTKYTLNGIYADNNNFCTIDGRRLYLYNHSKNSILEYNEKGKILAFNSTIKSFLPCLKKHKNITFKMLENFGVIETQDYFLKIDYLMGKFPNFTMFIPENFENNNISIDGNNFLNSLKILKPAIDKASNKIIFEKIEDDKIKIIAQNSDHGKIEQILNFTGKLEIQNFGLNLKLLFELKNYFKNSNLNLTMNNQNSPFKINTDNNKNSIFVIMPMQI